MENKLVTIATFPDALKAQIMRGRLEAEGIPAFIADEHTITNQPYLSMAYGGVRLQVMDNYYNQALEIIGTQNPFSILNAATEQRSTQQCPNCHSEKIEEVNSSAKPSFLTFLRNLLTSRTSEVGVRRFSCHNCGYHWIIEL